MSAEIRSIPGLIAQLFRTVEALNAIYPDRPFTPDGHLIGSIGEVVAAHTYGLILEKCSNEGFDARTELNQTVEIKLTGGDCVAVSSDSKPADLLIVLKLDRKTGFEEVYNGQFPLDMRSAKKASKRRTVSFRLNELRRINPKLLKEQRPLEGLNRLFEIEQASKSPESTS